MPKTSEHRARRGRQVSEHTGGIARPRAPVWGKAPGWPALGLYAMLAPGRLGFEKTRKGFADVL